MSKSFILYNSWYEAIKQLPADEKGMLLDAMFQFHITGEIPKLSPTANMAFNFIKPVFEENKTKYENKCKANRENINKRWKKEDTKNTSGKNDNTKNTSGINGKISYSDNYNENDNENDNENENKEREKESTPTLKNEEIDFSKLINIFNETCKNLPQIVKITESRKKAIRARVREYGKEDVVKVIKKTAQSKFLNGENDRGWKADFDWIFKPNNFLKILEGGFDKNSKNIGKSWKRNVLT